MEPEALYTQLGYLLASVPPDLTSAAPPGALAAPPPLSTEAEGWLARAYALVEAGGNLADIVEMREKTTKFGDFVYRQEAARPIFAILRRTAAVAGLKSPVAAQGAFIHGGNVFDA